MCMYADCKTPIAKPDTHLGSPSIIYLSIYLASIIHAHPNICHFDTTKPAHVNHPL